VSELIKLVSKEDVKYKIRLLHELRMQFAVNIMVAASVLVMLAVTGCGGSSTSTETSHTTPAPQPASNQSGQLAPVTIEVTVPGLRSKHWIPKRYTCDGGNVSLPVDWSHVPGDTAELAVFVVNARPINEKLFYDWAVAGLKPTLHGISSGRLPPGSVVGRNSFGNTGYSICPAKRLREEHFIVRVIALPHPLAARPGVGAEALYRQAMRLAKVVGLGGGSYERL
jgi:phosphatidylethanolamine-binding protein (PEBP) family uncharacterized protein